MRTALFGGLFLFVAVVTGLQLWLNPASGRDALSFRVGFLPVT